MSPEIAWGQGERTFSAMTPVGPAESSWGAAFDLTAIDWNGDGLRDVHICNDGPNGEPDRVLCASDDGFYDCDTQGANVALFCMGTAIGDINRDGLLDLYLSASEGHALLLNSEQGFYDATAAMFSLEFDSDQMGWGAAIVDLNNDGLPDLLSANGDFSMRDGQWPLWAFLQSDDGQFTESGEQLGFPQLTGGRGVIVQDLNGDGVVDVLMGDMARPPWLLLSDGCTDASWITLAAPPQSIVTVEADGEKYTALITDDPGYGASAPATLHIGLGTKKSIDRIELQIPGYGPVHLEGPITPRRQLTWTP
ncbi:MAG: hypothetical protein ACI8RZ_003864 [Myxococcota bacterium]